MSPEQIAMAIATDDVKSITMAPGIGKKTAQRIVLELKDKLAKAATADNGLSAVTAAADNAATGNIPKALEALSVLGYSASEVSPVLSAMDNSLPVEQLISLILKQMGRK